MTLLLNCTPPRDSMTQLTPSALSNTSGAIHRTQELDLRKRNLKLAVPLQTSSHVDSRPWPGLYSKKLRVGVVRVNICNFGWGTLVRDSNLQILTRTTNYWTILAQPIGLRTPAPC